MESSSILALLAAVCFALSATLQQKGALTLGDPEGEHAPLVDLVKNSWWLLGTGALLVGYLLQAIALANGRLSIIQPLLVTTVVFALPLGYYLTNQAVGRREIIGALVVVAGLALYAVFGDPASGNDTAPGDQWAIALTLVTLLCVALYLLGRRSSALRKASLLGITSGVLYGTSACLVKEVTSQLDTGGVSEVLSSWVFWAMSIAGIVAFVVQQMSLREGFLATSVATVSVANPVIAVAIGIVLFNETLSEPTWHKVVAWIGLGLGMFGAVVISQAGSGSRSESKQAAGTEVSPPG